MEQIHKIKNDRIRSRRAVAPIIATLLMIAIAVIGGVMIYVFTQGFFGNSAISTSPSVDTITMTGYDMREIVAGATTGVTSFDGTILTTFGDAAATPGLKDSGEEGTIFIKNVGQKPYSIAKLEVNGAALVFVGLPTATTTDGQWSIITAPDAKVCATTCLTDHQSAATVLPGQEAALLVSYDDGTGASLVDNTAANGRTIPVKITSAGGSVYNFNVVIGSKS